MKKLFGKFFIIFPLLGLMISCKKNLLSDLFPTKTTDSSTYTIDYKPSYSTLDEFRQAIANIATELTYNHVVAYLDTLENGYPDPGGRKEPLSRFAYAIVEKLGGNNQQVASAVDDVFHFDGSTFSLISYIMKAQMVNNISRQTSDSLINQIPFPPIAVDGFDPPMQPIIPETHSDTCCKHCKPILDVIVTSVYVEPCGNRSTKTETHGGKGLRDISKGSYYSFDGIIKGCNCPGKWKNTIQFPDGGVMGSDKSWIGFTTFQSGDNIITTSYTVCGITLTKTFTLSVK